MAPPTGEGEEEEKVTAFMSVTGCSHALARRILQEHGGDLRAALDAHFSLLQTYTGTNPTSMPVASAQSDHVDTRNLGDGGLSQLVSAGRSFRPSLLLDSAYRRSLYSRIGSLMFPSVERQSPPPVGLYHGNVGYEQQRPVVNDVNETSSSHFSPSPGLAYVSRPEHRLSGDSRKEEIEEEMIRIAIEASKHENSSNNGLRQVEDEELARVMALSLESAAEEKALRERKLGTQKQPTGVQDQQKISKEANSGKEKVANPSSNEGIEDSLDALWGNISTKELDEAVLLETAFFGGISGGKFLRNETHGLQSLNKELSPRKEPCLPSGSLVDERLQREQQDSKHCGRKESSALKMSGENLERILAAKEASLPPEPTIDDENTVTLVIRMPDGKRCGRRFLKSHKLRSLFNFIDAVRAVEPGTYRVVRQYPKRAFGSDDCTLSLEEVGLTSKQEVLFLELI